MNMYAEIFQALNTAKIKYLIVGGVAVNLHGYVRYTSDIDILLELDEKNLEKMDKLMKKMGYISRIPVEVQELRDKKKLANWVKEKGMKAYTFVSNTRLQLDIDILVEDSLKFKKHDKEKKILHAWDIDLPTISIDYLITMKRAANRKQDITDLEALLLLKES